MTSVRNSAEFEQARSRWQQLAERGRLAEARALVDAAWPWVEAQPDRALRDRVLANRAAIAIEMGEGAAFLPELKGLLLRCPGSEIAFLAAYEVSRAYELQRELKKAKFYARLAMEVATGLEDRHRLASTRNQLGGLLVAEGHFVEAMVEYEAALSLVAGSAPLREAIARFNLGYCLAVLNQFGPALSHLYASLRELVRLGSTRNELLARLDLAFALTAAGQPRRAQRHAIRALALARRLGARDSERNALFLLGGAQRAAGDETSARFQFRQLQNDFYPDVDYLPEILAGADLQPLINLRG